MSIYRILGTTSIDGCDESGRWSSSDGDPRQRRGFPRGGAILKEERSCELVGRLKGRDERGGEEGILLSLTREGTAVGLVVLTVAWE